MFVKFLPFIFNIMNEKNSSKIIKKITFSNNLTSTLKFVFFYKKKSSYITNNIIDRYFK